MNGFAAFSYDTVDVSSKKCGVVVLDVAVWASSSNTMHLIVEGGLSNTDFISGGTICTSFIT